MMIATPLPRIQQLINAGLLDEIEIHVIPVLFGGGKRLFDNLGADQLELVNDRAIHSPGVTHLRYRFPTSS